jgi:uncharacterized protein (UPF0248 family)
MVGTGLCIAAYKKRRQARIEDKSKCGESPRQIRKDDAYFDEFVPEIESKGFEDTVIYDLCKKAAVEPLFEKRNAELKEAATHIIVDRIGMKKRTTNEMWFDSASYLPNERQNGNERRRCDMILSTWGHQRGSKEIVSSSVTCDRYGRPYCLSSSSYRPSHRVSRIQSENVTALDRTSE